MGNTYPKMGRRFKGIPGSKTPRGSNKTITRGI